MLTYLFILIRFRNHDNAHEKLDMHQILQLLGKNFNIFSKRNNLLEQAEQEENKNPKKSLNYYKTASQSLLRLYSGILIILIKF